MLRLLQYLRGWFIIVSYVEYVNPQIKSCLLTNGHLLTSKIQLFDYSIVHFF
jgi:hypothetical protein